MCVDDVNKFLTILIIYQFNIMSNTFISSQILSPIAYIQQTYKCSLQKKYIYIYIFNCYRKMLYYCDLNIEYLYPKEYEYI